MQTHNLRVWSYPDGGTSAEFSIGRIRVTLHNLDGGNLADVLRTLADDLDNLDA